MESFENILVLLDWYKVVFEFLELNKMKILVRLNE